MLCSRCGKNKARITVEYDTEMGKITEYFCKECYEKRRSPQAENDAAPSGSAGEEVERDLRCAFCGNTVEDYLHSGLVGCAACYRTFAAELTPYIVRLQGNGVHCGKRPSADPKYEAAASLREILGKLERAEGERAGEQRMSEAQRNKLKNQAEELKLLLFGDDEEG